MSNQIPNPFTATMTRMVAPGGPGASVSARGFTFSADADGVVVVPGEVARELESHGFVRAPAAPQAKK